MPTAVDITGERYGRLVALEYAGYLRSGSQPKRAFRFRCDCGAEVVRTLMDVRRLDTMSCGCLKRDNLAKKPAHNRLSEGESSFRAVFGAYRKRARVGGLAFDLTEEMFRQITKADCYYCGDKPRQARKSHRLSHGAYVYNGIDRLDNSLGYVPGNVVTCCGLCNRAKGTMGQYEFMDMVRKIYRNHHDD